MQPPAPHQDFGVVGMATGIPTQVEAG